MPTKALFASFHSGLWVFIHIPAPGIKLDTFAITVTRIFSMKLTLIMLSDLSVSKAPSDPILDLKCIIFSSESWLKSIVFFGSEIIL